MITASAKKRENIAEYLLYMWQIEDLIRAYGLDLDRIEADIINRHEGLDEATRRAMRDWYESLIDMMRREGVARKGHLQLNRNTLSQLEELHRKLLADRRFPKYAAEYYKVLPLIVELRAKAGDNRKDELETVFEALYGLLMLRLQGKEVTPDTLNALNELSHFAGMLAAYYKKDQEEDIFKEEEQ